MDFKTIVENIFRMEEELDLFDKKIDGVHFWEMVRFYVFMQIAYQVGIYEQAYTNIEIDSTQKRNYYLNSLKNVFVKNPFFSPKSEILFWGHPRRKKMEDGYWWDIYSDPVIEYLENDYKCVLLERSYFNTHLRPAKTKRIKYLDLAFFISFILKKFRHTSCALSLENRAMLEKIRKHIYERFFVQIDLEKTVSSFICKRKNLLPIYSFILKRIRPRAAVVVCSYGAENFIGVCKDMGIPVVELQHGAISKYHVGYCFPAGVKKMFPDYFLTFGEYWKNLFDFPIAKENIISTGSPLFEKESGKYSQREKKDQVVFVSQGTIGAEMSKFAVELKQRQDFFLSIVYKLHPGEYHRWQKIYPWLINSGITVIDDDSVPLYKLLAESKILVGAYSTAVYEGLGLGLRTFLLNVPGIESMEELVETKAVSVVSTVDELVEKIKQPTEEKICAKSFFKPNALDNIADAIEEIMRREYG